MQPKDKATGRFLPGKGNPRKPWPQRFWDFVSPEGELVRPELGRCSAWMGQTVTGGYGRIAIGPRKELAHRVAYRLAHPGENIDDIDILHRCDNPPCCVDSHLFKGTHRDNMADMAAKGRHRSVTRVDSFPRGELHWTARYRKAGIPIRRAARVGRSLK